MQSKHTLRYTQHKLAAKEQSEVRKALTRAFGIASAMMLTASFVWVLVEQLSK